MSSEPHGGEPRRAGGSAMGGGWDSMIPIGAAGKSR